MDHITEETHQESAAPHASEESTERGHAIVLAPEILGYIGPLPVTNTLLVSWAVVIFLVILAVAVKLSIRTIPGKFQNFMELIIETGYSTVRDLASVEKAKVFFPWVMSFFLFILVANLLGLFPGFATITYKPEGAEHAVPLLRSINSDLNMTLSLALISVFITHFFAIRYLGFKAYLQKWFSLQMFGVFLFVGILELVSEFTKIVSLSFRLFGNIFAGEVVLGTVSSIFAFIVPLPFYFLELIVAFVQAAVFMMLTLVFMVLLSEKHEAH